MILDEYSRRGTDIYYVLRKIPLEKREAYLALHAFSAELNRISEHYREPAIAEQKLLWWKGEIERFFEGEAKHPILTPLEKYAHLLPKTALLASIEANTLSLKTHIFETRSELWQHYQHLGGIQFDLKAKILGHNANPTLTHTLGTLSEILRHMIEFRHFLYKQHLYFALDDFRKHQIDPQPLLQRREQSNLAPLFEDYWNQTQKELPPYTPALKPLYLEIKLKCKQIEQIKKDGWQWAHHQVELPPLRKLLLTIWPL